MVAHAVFYAEAPRNEVRFAEIVDIGVGACTPILGHLGGEQGAGQLLGFPAAAKIGEDNTALVLPVKPGVEPSQSGSVVLAVVVAVPVGSVNTQ